MIEASFFEDECEVGIINLGGRLVLMLMREGILVGEVVLVEVGVIVVVAGRVIFFEKRYLSVMEVERLGVGFGQVGGNIFDLGGDFVAVVVVMEVEDLEVEVGAVVRPFWGLFELEDVFFVAFESNVSGKENVQCWWASLWCSDPERLFNRALYFQWWLSG